MNVTNNKNKMNICDECKSDFLTVSSEMPNLCPECAYWLYGYKKCTHEFINGRCIKCHWNGNTSDYTENIKKERSQ